MRVWAWVIALCTGMLYAPAGNAQHSLVVLGLRSVEGDDAISLELSQALREAGRSEEGWFVRDQTVSLSQMVLAHGCDAVDLHCLSTIARGLNVDRVVYGGLHRDSEGSEYNFEVDLHLFALDSGKIETHATAVIAKADTEDAAALARNARDLIARINPDAAPTSSLTVLSNVDGAEVRLDGKHAGQIQGGALRLDDVSPGTYHVEVSAIGYISNSSAIALKKGESTNLEMPLLPGPAVGTTATAPSSVVADESTSGVPKWLPYSLLALGAAASAGLVASWVVIDGVNGDPLYRRYSAEIDRIDPTVDDVCVAASDGHDAGGQFAPGELRDVVDMCNRASTFEVLQYVFGGVAAASAATGAVLLVLSLEDEDEPVATVRPRVGLHSGGLTATLRF